MSSKTSMQADNCMAHYTMTKLKSPTSSHSPKRRKCKLRRISKPSKEDTMNIYSTLTSTSKNLAGIWYVINEISGTNSKALTSTKIISTPASSLSSTTRPDKLGPIPTRHTDLKISSHWDPISNGLIYKNVISRKQIHLFKFLSK